MALIELEDIYKIYNPGQNEVRALEAVNLRVEPGEMVAIIGRSGSGKSTLMNLLGCLDLPTAGHYRLHGQDIMSLQDSALSELRNREIGFIFQGFNLISSLTALENVELPLSYRGIGRARRRELAVSALRQVGLGERLQHRPGALSGGQQQRVAIARAIAARPPLILADEPTGNLDSHSGEEVMHILSELHREGRTILLITHDNAIAAAAPRILQMRDGHLAELPAIEGAGERCIHLPA